MKKTAMRACALMLALLLSFAAAAVGVFAAENAPAGEEAPFTGDMMIVYCCIIAVALAALIGVSILSHKKSQH